LAKIYRSFEENKTTLFSVHGVANRRCDCDRWKNKNE